LFLFVALGRGDHPIAFTAMLVGVLFFHELGHYLGMRAFGYRNVRMFFIPLFGAAVSGQKTTAKSYQEAIVTLLGPLPGLCLAAVLFGVGFLPAAAPQRHLLGQATALLGLINGFNLLPIFPLDGGRLLNQVLFSRNRFLEGGFQLLAAVALFALGARMGGWFFTVLGIWLLLAVRPAFKMNTIAQRVAGRLGGPLPPLDGDIPMPVFREVLAQLQSLMPGVKTPKSVAGAVFRIWEKMHVRPPGAAATLALLVTYLLAGLFAVPWVWLLFLPVARR